MKQYKRDQNATCGFASGARLEGMTKKKYRNGQRGRMAEGGFKGVCLFIWLFHCLEVDGFRVGGHGGLLESLSEGWVGVARPGDVLARSAVLDGEGGFGDHLASVGTDDVHTENAVSLSIGDELDKTLSLEVGLSTGVGAEGEGTDAVVDTGGLDVRFVLANPGDFGVGVHDTGDAAVVDVAVTLLDVLDGGDTLFLCLVGKHGAESAVTDHADVRVLGTVFLVDDQAALLVLLDSSVLETKALSVRATTNGNQDNIGIQSVLLATLGGFDAERNGRAAVVTLGDLGADLELDALLAQNLVGLLGDLCVHTRATNLVQEFDDGNFGAKARPDRSLRLSYISQSSYTKEKKKINKIK